MFDNMDRIVEVSSLALLGVLGVFLVLGIFWGFIRGRKKTTIRIITILVALPLALLLTPIFSRSLLKISVPFGGEKLSVSAHIEKFIMNALPDKVSVDGIHAVPQLVEGLAVVAINMVMFLILYFVFKWVSWIVYAVVSAKTAPKKQRVRSVGDDGVERIDIVVAKKGRLSGALLGVVQALIFFAFFMIPITGILSTLDRAANYQPQMAGFSSATVRSSVDGGLMDVYNSVDEFNDSIQSSAFGVISKYSGMQALGGLGVSYLSSFKVDGQKINLKNDAAFGLRLFKDFVAVYQEFNDERSFIEVVESWDDEEYQFVKSIIERVFSMTFVQLVFESSDAVVDIVNDMGVIDGKLDRFDDVGYEGEFQASAVDALKEILTSAKIKADLLNAVDLMQTIFGVTEVSLPGDATADASIYRSMKAVFKTFKDKGDVEVEAEKLTALLSSARNGQAVANSNHNIAFDLMKALFGFNFLQEVLADDAISQLYQKPIVKYVPNVNEGDAVFGFDFSTTEKADLVYSDMADLLISVSDCLGVVFGLMGDDMMDSLKNMGERDIEAFAGLMASLTNSETIGTFVRNVVIGFLESSKVEDMIGEIDALKDVNLFGKVIEKLGPANEEELDKEFWERELAVIIDLVKFALNFTDGTGDIAGSLGDMLRNISDSELLGEIVIEIVENLVNEMLGDNALTINDPAAFGALADIADGLLDVMNNGFGDGEGDLDPEKFFDVVFGGDDGLGTLLTLAGVGAGPDGEDVEPLVSIDLSVVVNLLPEGTYSGNYENDVKTLLDGFVQDELDGENEKYLKILGIFGI